jgi:hypothetical protein
MMEVNRAFGDIGRAIYGASWRRGADPERLRRVREILERATREIEELGRQAGEHDRQPEGGAPQTV